MSRHLFVFLQMSLIVLVSGAPTRILRSPCPDIFGYEKMKMEANRDWVFPSEDHRWRGVLTVPGSLPIFLKVKLLVPAVLLTKYVGRIELAQDKNEVVNKINNGSSVKIKYYVYFPANIPIPELILIEVNSRVICSQTPVPRRLKTIVTLEHFLMPLDVSFREGIGLSANRKKPTLPDELQGDNSNEFRNCGKGKNPLKSGRISISTGDWPWMVPLFRRTELGLQFLCSSTLVSQNFVVTAAHCIKFKGSEPIKKEDIIVYAGRFDLANWTGESTQPRELSEIFIHPDFDSHTLHSDLALLKFSKPVSFSAHVNPACLWEGDDDLGAVVGKKGIVFGWGTDGLGHKITPTPNLAVMPIVSQEECLRSRMEFLYLTTNRTLCAGFRNGTGPCSGDSGGGLLLPTRDKDGEIRWKLRGVVSLSLLENSQIMCDVHEYAVFTDVAKYQNWIFKLIGKYSHQ